MYRVAVSQPLPDIEHHPQAEACVATNPDPAVDIVLREKG